MVLQTLTTLGPVHGYAIAARLEQVSSGAIRLNMGTLYPGLMRLAQRGLVRGRWGVTENNRRARFYAITAAGRRELAAEKADWERTASIMRTLLNEPQ
jgi:transcriptional regulator